MNRRANPSLAPVADLEPRVLFLNNRAANQHLIASKQYARNVVVTSKYTALSFLPKIIFEFFRVVANVYFLIIAILQLVNTWSPTNRFSTAGPLLILLLITMVKQGREDFKRHQVDGKQNRRPCRIINSKGQTETIAWQELQVGHVVCVEKHEDVPADVVILATSGEEGRCFIETSNLDGEMNLKHRVVVKRTAQLIGGREVHGASLLQERMCAAAVTQLRGSIEHEPPNNQLYTFTGRILLDDDVQGADVISVGPENLLLRGCSLRSCAFVIGVVIFTGSETKLLHHSRKAASKQSKVSQTANRCMLLIFTTMFGLCLVSTIAAALWSQKHANRVWYLPFLKEADKLDDKMVNFFTFIILYNNLVPFSLYVSLDIVKVLQVNRMTSDTLMSSNGDQAVVRTSDLNEELGQVEYVFSDKTGTLTCNVLEFRKCSIGGISYGFGTTEIGRAVAALAIGKHEEVEASNAKWLDVEETDVHRESLSRLHDGMEKCDPEEAQVHYDPSFHFDDPNLLRALYAGGKQGELIHDFLTLLSLCHTVIPETDSATGTLVYQASSPDEEALVKAAKCLGYHFVTPAPFVKLEISCKSSLVPSHVAFPAPERVTQYYTIVNVNEFTSTRKRMSVVARNEETHEYIVYCKGADDMMLERTAPLIEDSDVAANAKLMEHLKMYAQEGLRTLVLGRRVLTKDEYKTYNDAYAAASIALIDRELQLDACADLVESHLQLLGVTAIEDKLQEGVPSAINDLRQAGIKVWVLTGDREETAMNIGHACRLLHEKMQVLYVNAEQIEAFHTQLDVLQKMLETNRQSDRNHVAKHRAMICNGKALVHLFPSQDAQSNMSDEALDQVKRMTRQFLDIAQGCKAVIACRVSPSQKAELVQLVRRQPSLKPWGFHPITLAIGDGANDVSMLQTAHVGVGICGKEGVQAVNASDFAIAHFRFLPRLVLLHGRWNYKRLCKVLWYMFYMNIAMVLSLFVYNFYNGQSGTPLYESYLMANWNLFLMLPIIVIGIYDQDIAEDLILTFPQLYRRGQDNSDFNMRVFAKMIGHAVGHALVCFYLCLGSTQETNYGLFAMGTIFYTALIATMLLKVTLLAQLWNKYHFAFLAISIGLFVFFLVVYPRLTFVSFDMYGVPTYMARLERFYALLVLCPVAAMVIDFCLLAARQHFYPHADDILREWSRTTKSKRPNDIVEPMSQLHASSINNLFVADQSTNEYSRSELNDNKFVMLQPP